MIKYYFNDTAPEINFEKQNKSFHFPWSNPSDPSLLDPILVSVWNRFWSDQALMKVEETPICLLETVLRFAAFLNLTRKNLIGIYFTWIEAHCSKNEKSGCFWLLSKYITIYITVSNCKEHCLKKFILIFSQTKLWGVFLRILTHCEKECFRNSESKAWVWHVTDNHAF